MGPWKEHVDCRYLPSSFDPVDPELTAVRIPTSWEWTSAERALREFDAHGVMMRIPLFWQLEIPLFRACKNVEAFIFVCDQANMALGSAAIRGAQVDCVVTDRDDAERFSAYALQRGTLPSSWIVIHKLHDDWKMPTLGNSLIAQEVHISPGIVVLEQCRYLRTARIAAFHLSPGFILHTNSEIISSDSPYSMNVRIQIPFPIDVSRTCECGEEIIERAR